jgi:hypothetical protein
MKAPTLKSITAEITPEGVKVTGSDVATAHRSVMEWANGEARRSTYSAARVAIVAGLIAMARTGSGSITVDALAVTEPITTEGWNDGAALARWLRSAGCAGCAGVAPLRVRQTRVTKGEPVFSVTVR